MDMTVRSLIEHLAQFDGDLKVKIRDPQIPMILHDVGSHDVEIVEFDDSRNGTTTNVVAIG